jgi:propane 2-monooxygenase large subunit
LRFDAKDMWTLDDVRGHTLGSPLQGFRALKPGAERDAAVAEYRKGFKINPVN